MNRSRLVLVAAAAATIGSAGCFSDPTSSISDGPSLLRLSTTRAFISQGDTLVVTVQAVDARGAQFPAVADFTTSDASVATTSNLVADTLPRQLRSSGSIAGVGAGRAIVTVTAGGVTDEIIVVVVPTGFPGTVSPATANVGDTITITGTSVITFDPAATTVTIGGAPTFVASLTASQIKLIAGPSVASGAVEITNLLLLGTIVIPSLTSPTTLTVAEAGEPANDAPAGGPTKALPASVGDTVTFYGSVEGATDGVGPDADDYFTVSTTGAIGLRVLVDWVSTDIDVDAFVLNSAGGGFCVLDGCSGASVANPEIMNVSLAAATTYKVYVNLWDNHGAQTPMTYRVRLVRTS
ncbi:MAG: hypothetical protein Q8Q85_02935 [Gemmatimonadales bacterium]|nr:hypothetical protein [Gemmatimonadales bacterium]